MLQNCQQQSKCRRLLTYPVLRSPGLLRIRISPFRRSIHRSWLTHNGFMTQHRMWLTNTEHVWLVTMLTAVSQRSLLAHYQFIRCALFMAMVVVTSFLFLKLWKSYYGHRLKLIRTHWQMNYALCGWPGYRFGASGTVAHRWITKIHFPAVSCIVWFTIKFHASVSTLNNAIL